MNVVRELGDAARYERQLERMHLRYAGTRRLYELVHDGASLADLVHDKRKVARLIARAVREGSYVLTPALRYRALVDRERELCRFALCDFVVHGVVAEVLDEVIGERLSPRLYSFRRGRSNWQALRDFARFVRAHRRLRPDPRARGLYVLRADVRRFCESVPLATGSPLWPLLRTTLGLDRAGTDAAWALVEGVVRPTVLDAAAAPSVPFVGMPFGSPVTNVVLNLYLGDVDTALDRVDGAFYARFGDDLVFAHVEPEEVRRAEAALHERVTARGLTLSAHKLKRLWFNGAARPSVAWPEAQPTTQVTLLGGEVRFDGTLALPREKWRGLVRDLRARIAGAAALTRGAPREERAAALCAVADELLTEGAPMAHPFASLLGHVVTSREQLGALDREVALAVAEALSGRRGPRAWRELSWAELRERHGLPSLVARRNRGRR